MKKEHKKSKYSMTDTTYYLFYYIRFGSVKVRMNFTVVLCCYCCSRGIHNKHNTFCTKTTKQLFQARRIFFCFRLTFFFLHFRIFFFFGNFCMCIYLKIVDEIFVFLSPFRVMIIGPLNSVAFN